MSDQKDKQVVIESLLNDYPFIWGYSLMDHGIWETDALSSNEKLVYFAIASKTNSMSAVAWPSYNTIARMTGLTKPTVIKSVKRLIDVDLIAKSEKAYHSNQYRIKSVQNSKHLGIPEENIITHLEKRMKMPVDQAVEEMDKPDTPPADPKPEKADPVPYKQIIEYLNQQTGSKFNHTGSANQKLIKARWNEMVKLKMDDETIMDQFKYVIDVKHSHWKDDAYWSQFLRPSTLFGNKFDQYRNEQPNKKMPVAQGGQAPQTDRFKSFLEGDD